VRAKLIAWLAISGLAWFGGCQYARNREADARIAHLEAVRDSLAAVALHRDSVYVVDTVTLTRVRRHVDTTYLAVTDTLIHRDTVVQVVLAERAACDAVIATCEERVADRDRQIVNLDSLLTLERKRGPSRLGCVAGTVVGSDFTPRLGAGCGIRLF
jgi:hypothetical protein